MIISLNYMPKGIHKNEKRNISDYLFFRVFFFFFQTKPHSDDHGRVSRYWLLTCFSNYNYRFKIFPKEITKLYTAQKNQRIAQMLKLKAMTLLTPLSLSSDNHQLTFLLRKKKDSIVFLFVSF